MRKPYFALILGLFGSLLLALLLVLVPKLSVGLVQSECPECSSADAIHIAEQLGRLDVVSLVLAMLGISVGFFAIFSFLALKDEARKTAKFETSEYLKGYYSEIEKEMEARIRLAVEKATDKFLNTPEIGTTNKILETNSISTATREKEGGNDASE